jgi:hypothetical protein
VRFRVLNMSIGLHLTRYTRTLSVPSAVTVKWGPLHYLDDQSLNIPGLELKVKAETVCPAILVYLEELLKCVIVYYCRTYIRIFRLNVLNGF